MDIWKRSLTALFALFTVLTFSASSTLAASPHQASLISVATNAKFGQILVDSRGMTLYTLSSEAGGQVKCTGGCLGVWPPLVVPTGTTISPTMNGVSGTLGVLSRPEGFQQLTLAQLPLYTFSHDSKPGDTNGEGIQAFGGVWHVARASLPLAATAMDRLNIRVTVAASTVWGKVSVTYTSNGRHVAASCAKASCSLNVPHGVTVHLKQTAVDTATWPFKKWQIRSLTGGASRVATQKNLSLRMTGSFQVKAVYVLAAH